MDYLSAIEEGQFVIAQANAKLTEEGGFGDELVTARQKASQVFTHVNTLTTWTLRQTKLYRSRHP